MTLDLSKINATSLGAVRKNLGAESETDTSQDENIAAMSPRQFVARYAAWHLGSGEWGRVFYTMTHEADAAEVQS